jgi:NNP family nitrate/nitrite transporter-like MFS transporter
VGAARLLQAVFLIVTLMALILTLTTALIPLTIACLVSSIFLGLGSGAVFKLVPQYFAGRTGTVTGIVGAAGGLGGFFPPLILGAVRQALGSYTVGFALLALTSLICFLLNQRVLVTSPPGEQLRQTNVETR